MPGASDSARTVNIVRDSSIRSPCCTHTYAHYLRIDYVFEAYHRRSHVSNTDYSTQAREADGSRNDHHLFGGDRSRARSNSQRTPATAAGGDADARHRVASLTAQLAQRDHRIRGLEQGIASKLAEVGRWDRLEHVYALWLFLTGDGQGVGRVYLCGTSLTDCCSR